MNRSINLHRGRRPDQLGCKYRKNHNEEISPRYVEEEDDLGWPDPWDREVTMNG
jgi:hypothetical protein